MEYILEYPKSNERWFRMLVESIRIWWMKKQVKDFEENVILID
jgi:hypothetical protein